MSASGVGDAPRHTSGRGVRRREAGGGTSSPCGARPNRGRRGPSRPSDANTFSGFTSAWITPSWCRASSATARSPPIATASAVVIRPPRRTWSSSVPFRYRLETMYGRPDGRGDPGVEDDRQVGQARHLSGDADLPVEPVAVEARVVRSVPEHLHRDGLAGRHEDAAVHGAGRHRHRCGRRCPRRGCRSAPRPRRSTAVSGNSARHGRAWRATPTVEAKSTATVGSGGAAAPAGWPRWSGAVLERVDVTPHQRCLVVGDRTAAVTRTVDDRRHPADARTRIAGTRRRCRACTSS